MASESASMRRLPHGYTNQTTGNGSLVRKVYEGPDASRRRDRERAALADLAGRIPVPPLLDDVGPGDDRSGDDESGDDGPGMTHPRVTDLGTTDLGITAA